MIEQPGLLILLGAPLGNPDDASPRFAKTLGAADVVAAEDTRRVRRLARELGVV
ncbi:MAG: 16S rRNA (cytidine(1402)-2'-O)-methyltransferase, partial [Micromonosporaceae bacterium]